MIVMAIADYYVGVFSPCVVVQMIGISFFGLGSNRGIAIAIPVCAWLGWVITALLVLADVLPDAGLISVHIASPLTVAFGLTTVSLVMGLTLYQARYSRRTMLQTVRRSHEMARQVMQRDAQLGQMNRSFDLLAQALQGDGGSIDLAVLRFTLAKTLWDTRRDSELSRSLAMRARELFAASGDRQRGAVAEVDAWLASLPR